MPLINIAEMLETGSNAGIRGSRANRAPVASLPAGVVQQINVTASSQQSAAFQANTGLIRIKTDMACRIAVGTNPTADGTSLLLAAGDTEYFGVTPGHKLAVISA